MLAEPNTHPEALLTEPQAADLLNISIRTLQNWRVRGGGPSFLRLGRVVRYQRRDLFAWIEANKLAHTSQGAA